MAASNSDPTEHARLTHRSTMRLTSADVLSTARALCRAFGQVYVPHIIDRILHLAAYLPGTHVRVTGFSRVTASFAYLVSDPLPDDKVERVRVRTISRHEGTHAAAIYTWWVLGVCEPAETETFGRRLFARERMPIIWSHEVHGDRFETHECEIYSHEDQRLSEVVRCARPGECIVLIAQAYPDFANCVQEAELSVVTPLGFDLESEPRLWGDTQR